MISTIVVLLLICSAHLTIQLDNGLARTPTMGWMAWERFRCNTDCINDPKHCIGEQLFKDMADRMVSDGYLRAGYQYVSIDDCWAEKQRDSTGQITGDLKRFPSGIKHLGDYLHSRGLKLGIYGDYGTYTCAGYPGSLKHLQQDANTFASYGADMLKFDGCYSDLKDYPKGYPLMGRYLNETKRPILYSCSWPAYQESKGMVPDYKTIAKTCNLWRNFDDIQDSWTSVLKIINFYGTNANRFLEVAGPGNWNDPDELIIGNFGLSHEQQRVQMAIWAIISAPLIMSVDLRTIKPDSRAILLNKYVIAIDQERSGS